MSVDTYKITVEHKGRSETVEMQVSHELSALNKHDPRFLANEARAFVHLAFIKLTGR